MKNYDAIVIGAGVIGCATAYQLASDGYSVLILERGEPACGASGGNLGQISLSDRTEPWHMKLAKETIAFYRNELAKKFDIEFEQSGGCIVLENEAQLQAAEEAVEELHQLGVEAKICTGDEISRVEPNLYAEKLQGVLYCPEEGKLNPFQVTLGFLQLAKESGAELLKNTDVTGFTIEQGVIVSVHTNNGDFSAKWVINCTGPRAGFVAEMAGQKLDALKYHKGTAFVTQPLKPTIRGSVTGGGFLMKGHGPAPKRRIAFCGIQSAHGSIIIGQATEECESDDREMNVPAITLMAKRFLSFYPSLEDTQVVRAWAAVTTYTKDGLPVYGFGKKVSNLLHAAGFKGAFTTAYGVGKLVKETLKNGVPEEFAGFNPDRVVEY